MENCLFTIFTPTHNRAHLLPRLYESLKKQTFKDFIWLIIDDGSSDNTLEVVRKFQEDSIITINYYFIENGYLHKAMKLSAEVVTTKYIIRIDDDDELTEDCVETFYNEWKIIESNKIFDIGEIRALSQLDDGTIAGKYQPKINQPAIDITYTERNIKDELQLENISCRRVDIWKKLFHDEDKWLYNKVTYISDHIFWNRLSKLSRTRYIFVVLRYFHDTPASTTKRLSNLTKQSIYNKVFSRYVSINELTNYYRIKPLFFIKEVCIYGIYAFSLRLRYADIYNALDSIHMRYIFLITSPVLYLYSLIIRLKIKDK